MFPLAGRLTGTAMSEDVFGDLLDGPQWVVLIRSDKVMRGARNLIASSNQYLRYLYEINLVYHISFYHFTTYYYLSSIT